MAMGGLVTEVLEGKLRGEEPLVRTPDPVRVNVFGVEARVTSHVTVVPRIQCASWRRASARRVARAPLMCTVPALADSTPISSSPRG